MDNLYKEFKDLGLSTNSDFPLEKSRISIINSIDFESNLKKEYIKAINKDIIEKINKFLSEPKLSLDNIFFENSEKKVLFNKTVAKLYKYPLNVSIVDLYIFSNSFNDPSVLELYLSLSMFVSLIEKRYSSFALITLFNIF